MLLKAAAYHSSDYVLGTSCLPEALGGRVGPSQIPEIGVMDVALTEEGASGVLMDGLPERFETLQWHSADITRLPVGAQLLAISPACAVQAMKWRTRAY
jgi:GMP synthase-like glutamine amidotransferase